MWSLSSSEIISQTLKDSYKQSRHEDDLNQPLSVQPWGFDGDKRRYWLIEGQDDTSFRLYRENAKSDQKVIWWNMGGSIEELKALAERLDTKDTTQAARRLSSKIISAIPRFEATDEVRLRPLRLRPSTPVPNANICQKRRRREYRQMRRAQFAKPEPGFSLYEGRTRGKRMRYTFDDDEDFDESDFSARRSGRHSDRSTPAEVRGPVVTASGRQIRAREGGMYGESLLSGQSTAADTPVSNEFDGSEASGPIGASARASRQAARNGATEGLRKRKFNEIYNGADQMSGEEEEEEDGASSGGWNSADNELEEDQDGLDQDDDLSDAKESSDEGEPSSLVVKLKVPGQKEASADRALPNGNSQADTVPARSLDMPVGRARDSYDNITLNTTLNTTPSTTLDTTATKSKDEFERQESAVDATTVHHPSLHTSVVVDS